MSYAKSIRLLLALIPPLGLTSCVRERTREPAPPAVHAPAAAAPEVFRPVLPIIVRRTGNVDLSDWDRSEDKMLDLNDALDFSASRVPIVEVTARCDRGANELIAHAWFEDEAKISIARVIPTPLLTRDLVRAPVDCTFEVQLNNGQGQRHGYLMSATIKDHYAGVASLDSYGSEPPLTLRATNLAGIKLRYDNEQPSWAQLICEEGELPALPFNHVVDLSEFDQRIAKDFTHPRQTCRVVILQPKTPGGDLANARRRVVSNQRTIQFGESPWWLEPMEVKPSIGIFKPGDSITIADYRIHNLDAKTRRLRFPQRYYDGVIQVFGDDPNSADELAKNWVRVLLETPVLPKELNGDVITVPPDGSVRIRIAFFSAWTLLCTHSAINARVAESVYFEDLGVQGETLASVRLPTPRPGRLRVNPAYGLETNPTPSPRHFCAWD